MNLIFSGNKRDLENKISEFVEKSDINKFINGLTMLSSCFDVDNEHIIITTSIPESNPDVMELLIPEMNYNIRITAFTIIILAMILDVKFTKGVVAYGLNAIGFNSNALVRIEEKNGEKCVLLEILRIKSHTITESVLPPTNKECFNNNLCCKYRSEGQCEIKKEDVHNIILDLCKKNVIKEYENGEYKYNV